MDDSLIIKPSCLYRTRTHTHNISKKDRQYGILLTGKRKKKIKSHKRDSVFKAFSVSCFSMPASHPANHPPVMFQIHCFITKPCRAICAMEPNQH